MTDRPLMMRWDGEALAPVSPYWSREADKALVIGEVYPIQAAEERSAKSHAHYFASVTEAWKTLPERYDGEFASADALRKFALIKAGFCDRRSIVASSKSEAQRIAGFIKPMDEFAIVTVEAATITVYTAKSQSMGAMGKSDFGASKQAVLEVLASMLEVTPQALQQSRAA